MRKSHSIIENVLDEFRELTNEEAYVHIFSKRMMKPVPNKVAEYFGSDQRIDLLPLLHKQIHKLPTESYIFDVGAGAGDVVDFALKDAPHNTTINIEEPNPALIHAYLSKLKKYPYLHIGNVYEGPVQDYYQGRKRVPSLPQQQNLILAIHMIYHLTDFTLQKITPQADLIQAISFLYGLLAPGGSLFIVYADLQDSLEGEAVCGMAEKFFRQHYPNQPFADNLVSIYQARNHLLGPSGMITEVLSQQYPNTNPILQSEKHQTHFFGESPEDIAVLALATELCPSNSQPFELAKLQFCLEYVQHYSERIGLVKEQGNVPQKGLWRANEPQVIAILQKGL